MAGSGDNLRQRKKDSTGTAVKKTSGTFPVARNKKTGGVRLSTLLYIVLFAVGFAAYYDPERVFGLVKPYIFRTTWQPVPSSSSYDPDFTADVAKRDAVVGAFKHAWLAYERDAMGDDEYHPISHEGTNLTEAGGIGYTIVDSIDTMLMMHLDEEYQRARDWIEKKMSFDRDAKFNTFETTIRVLGGLLSTYHLSGEDPLFLEKAKELADRMLPVFDTPSGLPLSMVNLGKKEGVSDVDNRGLVSTAEAATLQLEFKYLSLLTDEEIYWEKAEKVMQVIKNAHLTSGLASIFMNPEDGRFVLSAIRLGSRGDSYYEYLLKQYVQTNLSEPVYRVMYDDAMNGVLAHLVQKSTNAKLTYTSELIPERNPAGEISWRLIPKQDHLVCFLGGNLMLGAITTGALTQNVSVPPKQDELTEQGKRDWQAGVALIETCMRTHDTATGLSPEIAHFRIPTDGMDFSGAALDWYIKGARIGEHPPYDARYILRPETVESLFVAFRLTGNKRYRDYGWSIFQAIEKHCRVESGGYASIINVDESPARMEDKMETFFMSETLKYLYLLFDDASTLPLSEYVFNTEAHPFPIFNPTIRTGFS